jgi:hypothetical protein
MNIRIFLPILLIALTSIARASRHDDMVAASEKPVAVAGGETFSVPVSFDQTFQGVVTSLQKAGNSIDTADKDAGQVLTSIVVSGGWHQTGTRVAVTIIRDSATSTIVRVCVTEQFRYKALQTEPWGDPALSSSKTAAQAAALKSVLGGR